MKTNYQPTHVVLAYNSDRVLGEAYDRQGAAKIAEWYRAAGEPCVVRKVA